ncbi:hypothetical protein V8B97DRAFT_1938716 [Scleroderma yunnanense]
MDVGELVLLSGLYKAIYHGSRAVLLVMVLGFVVEVGVMIFAMSRGTIASEVRSTSLSGTKLPERVYVYTNSIALVIYGCDLFALSVWIDI